MNVCQEQINVYFLVIRLFLCERLYCIKMLQKYIGDDYYPRMKLLNYRSDWEQQYIVT